MDNSEINEPDPSTDKLRVEGQSPSGMPETSPTSDLEKWLKPDTPDEIIERFSGIQRRASYMEYSGPLPPASELIKYEEAHPGAADRVIGLAEDALRMRNSVHEKQIGLARRRVNASVIMSLGMLFIAGLAILFDPAWLSIPFGAFGLLTLIIRELIRIIRKPLQQQPEQGPPYA